MKDRLLVRIDQLILQGTSVLATHHAPEEGWDFVDAGKMQGFRSALLSFIERVHGKEHSFYTETNSAVKNARVSEVEAGMAILKVIRDEIEGDWLFTMKELVSAELFTDFIEMAEHLLSQGYKDPAAVIIGSVLEEHIRQLCIAKNIDIETNDNGKLVPKTADKLNSDLAKSEVYTKLDQKQITTWQDLRNNAAHGNYSKYSSEQVQQMINWILGFMSRSKIS
jgi:RiboL-PSP-HEPN